MSPVEALLRAFGEALQAYFWPEGDFAARGRPRSHERAARVFAVLVATMTLAAIFVARCAGR